MSKLENKLDEILSAISVTDSCATELIDVVQKVSRLEESLVCSNNPTVDDVLYQILSRKCKATCVMQTPAATQPEAEMSPPRSSRQQEINPIMANEAIKGVCLAADFRFDIFDERCDIGAQRDELKKFDKAVQSQSLSKPRRCRVNGRGVQTDAACLPIREAVSNTHASIQTLPSASVATMTQTEDDETSVSPHGICFHAMGANSDEDRKTSIDLGAQANQIYKFPPSLPLASVQEWRCNGSLRAGDILVVRQGFSNAFESGNNAFFIDTGSVLVISGFDSDGDALAFISRTDPDDAGTCLVTETTIWKEDFRKCARMKVK